ncbi:MAG: hypothetical protein RMK61_08675 [Bacteroidota bacterium]|nr:hypothetical protein [Bacteroidota bacterium]
MRDPRPAGPLRRLMRRSLAGLALSAVAFGGAWAQPALETRLLELLAECAAQIRRPDSLFAVSLQDRLLPLSAYPGWIHGLTQAGWRVRASTDPPLLEVINVEVRVRYRRLRRGLERSAAVELTYRILGPEALVLRAGRCAATSLDTLPRSARPEPLPEGWPGRVEQQASAAWWERYAQPLFLAASTAALLYLLFTVRSPGS